jgi:hypothetical protein
LRQNAKFTSRRAMIKTIWAFSLRRKFRCKAAAGVTPPVKYSLQRPSLDY